MTLTLLCQQDLLLCSSVRSASGLLQRAANSSLAPALLLALWQISNLLAEHQRLQQVVAQPCWTAVAAAAGVQQHRADWQRQQAEPATALGLAPRFPSAR